GTEDTMSTLRPTRAITRTDKLPKSAGCYHRHADPFLSRAGSGLATFDIPSSAGVPAVLVADTITVPYNDIAAVEETIARNGNEIAAIIVEPVAGNMGVVPPQRGFLEALR